MTPPPVMPSPGLRPPGLPIWVQILGVVAGALIAAQVVTLALTLLLPPAPPQQHSLADIAGALRGGAAGRGGAHPLIRTVESAPPSFDSPGWVVSPSTTTELARLLGAPEADVRILFYAPPPLAGTGPPPPRGPRMAANGRRILQAGFSPPMTLALAGPPPGGMGGGGPPMGGMGPPGAGGMGPGAMRPGGTAPSGMGPGVGPAPGTSWPSPSASDAPSAPSRSPPAPGSGGGPAHAGPGGSASPPDHGPPGAGPGGRPGTPPGPALGRLPRSPLDAAVFRAPEPIGPVTTAPAATRAPAQPRPDRSSIANPPPAPAPVITAVQPPPAAASPARTAAPEAIGRPLAIPVVPSVFGFTRPSSYVEGEFVAAQRSPAGWITVRPKPEGFPNAWQRRVLLWFLLSFALVAPPAYLLARRLVIPLHRFAESAAQLGRDPMAELPPLTGPAEVGRAASAFNLMRLRLRRYVDDRTGMISAITHDLRTPLARMRFKMERAAPALRASLTRDVDQMEAMISSVLSFMRDELSGSPREYADVRSILECVVDEAGDRAELEAGPPVNGRVDLLGLQRVFENLVSNAIKYGGRARVRMRTEADELIVEIADEGPGLPPEELENVFRPFYRSPQARNSGAPGVGLGLAVSRSILRAHGGDLTLVSTDHGLITVARLPLSGQVLRAA